MRFPYLLACVLVTMFLSGCETVPAFREPDPDANYREASKDLFGIYNVGRFSYEAAVDEVLDPVSGRVIGRQHLVDDVIIAYKPILNPAGTKVIAQEPIPGKRHLLPGMRMKDQMEKKPTTGWDAVVQTASYLAWGIPGVLLGKPLIEGITELGNKPAQIVTQKEFEIVKVPELVPIEGA